MILLDETVNSEGDTTKNYTSMEIIIEIILKEMILFYGHMSRISPMRLANRIFTYFHDKGNQMRLVQSNGKSYTRCRHYISRHPRYKTLKKKLRRHEDF